jgi:hypothetical protein
MVRISFGVDAGNRWEVCLWGQGWNCIQMGLKVNEFKKIKNDIKQIDFMALFFTVLARTKSKKLNDLIYLRNLSCGHYLHAKKQ